ncbi:MAG: penicillin acylase family protein, partial [Limnobacter sp.]|nr:penicillin acylase family protein [Limnobacter sp.]
SLEEFIDLHGSVLGVPWVNTVASGPNQPAYYGDLTVVPHVTDEKTAECSSEPFHTVIQQVAAGLPVLDGSRSECDWGSDADAPAEGVFGRGNLPSMQREDYVHNCNDSYWLTNPRDPITGFDRIIGDEDTERTLRTRLCILQAERRLDGSDEFGSEPLMTQDLLKDIALNSEIYSATLTQQQVLGTLCMAPALVGTESPEPVQTGEACAALEQWDGKTNLDSQGAHLWREFWTRVNRGPAVAGMAAPVGPPELPNIPGSPLAAPTNTWTNAYSSDDPVNTPNGLNPANPFIAAAFADAIRAVQASGFAFDAPLGDIQFSDVHNNELIPVFGGSSPAGAFTIARTGSLNADGYRVDYGNSYIQAVTWVTGPDGSIKPKADAMLTYSNSTDPASPFYDDYTKAYAAKDWLTLPFTKEEIEQQKISQIVLTGN